MHIKNDNMFCGAKSGSAGPTTIHDRLINYLKERGASRDAIF